MLPEESAKRSNDTNLRSVSTVVLNKGAGVENLKKNFVMLWNALNMFFNAPSLMNHLCFLYREDCFTVTCKHSLMLVI